MQKITYAPEVQKLFDMWHYANDLNDENAQFYLACCFMKSNQKSTQKKVFSFFKKIANQDYTKIQTDAQYRLSQCYENGYGITKSYPQACKWYRSVYYNVHRDVYKIFEKKLNSQIEAALDKSDREETTPEIINCVTEAAEGGDLESQKYLIELYRFGRGNIDQDIEEMAYWAERAAENGDVKSMCTIGGMYYDGRGVNKNHKKALYWLEKAAAKGEDEAALLLGSHYRSQKQYKIAMKWYKISADLSLKWRSKKFSGKTAPLTPSDLFK